MSSVGVLEPREVDAPAGDGVHAAAVEGDEVVKLEPIGLVIDSVGEVSEGGEFSVEVTTMVIFTDGSGELGV